MAGGGSADGDGVLVCSARGAPALGVERACCVEGEGMLGAWGYSTER